MSVDAFLQQVKQVTASQSIDRDIAQLLDVSLPKNSRQISSLQNELVNIPNDDAIDKMVESLRLFDSDWSGFESLVSSYLKLCRYINPSSILQSHDLYLNFLNDLSVAFLNNQYGAHLTTLLYNTLNLIIPIMIKLDKLLNTQIKGKKYKRLIFISTLLSKIFNHLRALKSEVSPKKTLVLFISIKLNKIYFIINSPLLCANIFANMNNIVDFKLSRFPMAQQVEHRYILGRYYLIKDQIYKSFHHLNWSFNHCHLTNDSLNKVKILRYLIPAGLLLEKYPNYQLLQQYDELRHYYEPLIRHLQRGNHFEFQLWLFQNQSYFKSKSLLILLSQRSRVLIMKNLIKRSLIIMQKDNYRLTYQELETMLSLSFRSAQQQTQTFQDQLLFQNHTDFSEPFIENVCTSLIENGLVKGNILSRARLIVFSKRDTFPDVFLTYQKRFGLNPSEKWMDL